MRICSRCHKNPRTSYSCWCLPCLRKFGRMWQKKNADRWHGYQIKCKFGISANDYAILLAAQKGVCAICGREERAKRNKRLAVDHDKISTLVRGLLCARCNQAIGLLDHNPRFLESAIHYLQKTNQTNKTKET